ncbi:MULTISPECIES: TonB-dependent receptor domain-containing protein [unclassified Paraflavitalea]|uniref:TonB-dependent receptor n=1 Tax=unclassified Paraflavitalea TaxID=2798305 RepID=UPI003D32E683
MSKISALFLFILMSLTALAQTGKISGRILDEKNQPVAGATVKIVGLSGGVTSSNDGYFTININAGKKYNLEITAVGYEKKTIEDVEVVKGGVNELSITLSFSKSNLSTVTVTAQRSNARRETAASIISFQKNTNTVASVISAETIRRSPDRNTGEVLKRTPGASIQEGRFIVVRGLADRYNQAMLNGILLTSTEPDRKTFSFDLIPASMIDNIVINKAFVPEYPGEWAGGLIQVNTKDIPSANFFNVQLGTGFNTQTIGKDFYRDKPGKYDWLGIDDGTRALPSSYTTKSEFDLLTSAEKTAIGKQMRNAWAPEKISAPFNAAFQMNGGFTSKWFGKTVGGSIGISYNKSNRFLKLDNRSNSLASGIFSTNYDFQDDRFSQNITVGALASFAVQLNSFNKISAKAIINTNTTNSVTNRSGIDYTRDELLRGTELSFKQNTFFTTQLAGDHSLSKSLKLKWYGAFNILDGYIPDQRRILYSKSTIGTDPYKLVISNSLSQQSGSRIYQDLSDYIYTAGGDLSESFELFGQKQTVKAGYMLQIKDRLYDAKLFANYLPSDNANLRLQPATTVFDSTNFGNGTGTLFGFDAIKGRNFRYLANTILNAGFLQFDNQFGSKLRVVWGGRFEHYDQLVGSVKTWDPRHTHTVVQDFLPGLNATYKVNPKTNIRVSGSQTVIRPELRELSFLNIYDFELNASVQGNPNLKRTKVTNFDLRYELYPRSGEVFSAGAFYKYFANPIEQIFNEGSGGASTFSYQNPEKANTFGLELELRKKLDKLGSAFKNFTVQANGAYIYSRIKDQGFKVDRPLQGQSPYLVNVGLLYDVEKAGLNITLLYNRIGERIYLVGDLSAGAGSPDIYEAPRDLIDFQVAKKVWKKKGEFRLNISDILNQTQYFYQNADSNTRYEKGKDAVRFSRKFGTGVNLSFNYSF